MKSRILLIIDAVINLLLGLLLAIYPKSIIKVLGIPYVENAFYPNILGAVFIGIGIALVAQVMNPGTGLGLKGAVAINMCGGLFLAGWLLFGKLSIPGYGQLILWILVAVLVGLSGFEYFNKRGLNITNHQSKRQDRHN